MVVSDFFFLFSNYRDMESFRITVPKHQTIMSSTKLDAQCDHKVIRVVVLYDSICPKSLFNDISYKSINWSKECEINYEMTLLTWHKKIHVQLIENHCMLIPKLVKKNPLLITSYISELSYNLNANIQMHLHFLLKGWLYIPSTKWYDAVS